MLLVLRKLLLIVHIRVASRSPEKVALPDPEKADGLKCPYITFVPETGRLATLLQVYFRVCGKRHYHGEWGWLAACLPNK